MNNLRLYRTWTTVLRQLVPSICPTQVTNLAWLIVGLYLARSVYASAIVKKWPFAAQVTSLTRRLSRFLDNPQVNVRRWYRPTAEQITARWAGRTLTLIIDASKVGFGHQLLRVAVAHRRRALPLVWCWLKGRKGHCSARVQLAVLDYARRLLRPDTRVIVVGDAEFGSIDVLRQCDAWGWAYVLRQKRSHWVTAPGQVTGQPIGALVTARRQWAWWPQARLTAKWQRPTTAFAYWGVGEAEPWLLATNLSDRYHARQAYARRMWIEEMFADLKDHGFDLEASQLRHFARLSRLTLAVCLLYVWLLQIGQRVVHAGQRFWVDRRDRRDLSLFRIGHDFVERCLILDRPFTVAALSPQVSGS